LKVKIKEYEKRKKLIDPLQEEVSQRKKDVDLLEA